MNPIDVGNQLEDVVRIEDVSVRYRMPGERIRSFKEYIIRLAQKRIRFKEFQALKAINLHIQKGERFGVIGNNGAGKSTLLKVISRVLIPSKGRVWIKGKVSPLLELGAGFHPELTGRENVFLYGTILGHPHREIEEHMDEIIEFSELGPFMNTPLRSFSSGMHARLGFAVSTTWEPDILILDEVLAVGDESFQLKCETRMKGFRDGRTTIILVSHSMDSIQSLCERVAWLDHGTIRAIGPASEVIAEYRQSQAGA